MSFCKTVVLVQLLALSDVTGATLTSPNGLTNKAGTSLLLRQLEEAPVSKQHISLLNQLGIDQSATDGHHGNHVDQSQVAVSTHSAPGGTPQSQSSSGADRPAYRPPAKQPVPVAKELVSYSAPQYLQPAQEFPSSGPQFRYQEPRLSNPGLRSPSASPQIHSSGPQSPTSGSQFRGSGPQFSGPVPQFSGPTAPLPVPPPPFTTPAPSFSSRAVNAINSLGSRLRSFGTSLLDRRPSFPSPPPPEAPVVLPPPKPLYAHAEGRVAPVLAASLRQRRANWQPGHPFQGRPLEDTYLDPNRRRPAEETLSDRRVVSERDVHQQPGGQNDRRVSQRQQRPDEVQRDHYDTFHRESYSRRRVEPITDGDEYGSHEERKEEDDGHRHALGENRGYPRDHAARHVYGDGHRAGDPYNIRPTDEEVERGYAREEEHDHYYSQQRYDDEAEFGDEEGEQGRRRRPTGRGKRRRRPQSRPEYDYEEDRDDRRGSQQQSRPEYNYYEDDVIEDKRSSGRQRQKLTKPVYDYYDDYSEDYSKDYAESEEDTLARVPVLEDHADFRPERRPATRTRQLSVADDSDIYVDDDGHTPKQRYPSKERFDPRDHYAPSKHGKTSRPFQEEADRRTTRPERRRAYDPVRSQYLDLPERHERYEPRDQKQPVHRQRQKRAADVEPEDSLVDTGGEDAATSEVVVDKAQITSVRAQGLKGFRSNTSPAFGALERTLETVRRQRQAEEKSGEETTQPLGSSEMEYPRNPHNPANFIDIPETSSVETAVPASTADEEQQQKKTDLGHQQTGASDDDTQQSDNSDPASEETSGNDGNAGAGTHQIRDGHSDEQGDVDYIRDPVDRDEAYQQPVWWESEKETAHAFSDRRGPNSVTDVLNSKRHQKRDAFGRSPDHAEFGSHFPSAKPDKVFEQRASVYISDESIPSWGPGYDGSSERHIREAAPSVGGVSPSANETDSRQVNDDSFFGSRDADESSESLNSFAEIEPVQTNKLYNEQSEINASQRLQELIDTEESMRNRDEGRRPGGYRDQESLGSRRPGGFSDSHHDNRRHHGNEDRRHGDDLRYYGDERRTGGERYNGDYRQRPAEAERRPVRQEISDERDYYRQPPQQERPQHHEEEDQDDGGRRRYPEDEQPQEDDRRHDDSRPDDEKRGGGHAYRGDRRPDDYSGQRYYVVTPNELTRDDVTSYEKPRPNYYRRGEEDRYNDDRRASQHYHRRPQEDDKRQDERRHDGDGRPDQYDRRPAEDDRRDDERRYDDKRRPDSYDRRPAEDDRREDGRRYDEERRNTFFERRPNEDDRRDGGGRYYFSRRPEEDGRRYANADNAGDGYHGDGRPSDGGSSDDSYHGDSQPTNGGSSDDSYHGDDRPSDGGSSDDSYHGDERRPDEDERESGGRRHLHEEPEERPKYYQEPDSRYPDSAEDAGEGGYYRQPHPEEVEQERLYRRPENGGRYYSENERKEGEDTQEAAPQETEEDLYSGPNQGYYDGGAPGYYGNDGPSFTRNHDNDQHPADSGLGDGDYRNGAADGDGRPAVTSSDRDVTADGPDESEADKQVSSFINQMFKEYDPFRRGKKL